MNIYKLTLYGPLPIRILAGIAFIAHGIPKLADPAMTQGFFGNIGLPPELSYPHWPFGGNRRDCSPRWISNKNSINSAYNRNDRQFNCGQAFRRLCRRI